VSAAVDKTLHGLDGLFTSPHAAFEYKNGEGIELEVGRRKRAERLLRKFSWRKEKR
jgi:hypothetical protein